MSTESSEDQSKSRAITRLQSRTLHWEDRNDNDYDLEVTRVRVDAGIPLIAIFNFMAILIADPGVREHVGRSLSAY